MSDDVVWHCIRHGHCSFMAKIETGIFCRNPYNLTGICNRSSCPLANSRYATIRDHDGIFYLYMKTAERAHLPNKLWERVKLPRNYEKAIEVINKHLEFWPKLLVHKLKQRLTKMTQYRIRMRKLQLKVREKLMTVPRKNNKIDAKKATKAEVAARLDNSIQSELLERLKTGCYSNPIINYPFDAFDNIVDKDQDVLVSEDEIENEMEYVADDEMEMEMDDMEDFEVLKSEAAVEKSAVRRSYTKQGIKGYADADDDLLGEQVAKKNRNPRIGRKSTNVTRELERDEDTRIANKGR